jgi:hypothetical protein
MDSSASGIERIVRHALDLRTELVAAAGNVHPNNLAADGATTVQAALLDLRAVLDAFLERDDPDREITGEQSTE